MTDFISWRDGPAHLWVAGNDRPPSRAQRIDLKDIQHVRLRYALWHWRDRFGLDQVDIESIGLSALVADIARLGGQSGLIAATSDDPMDWLLLFSTADFGFADNLHHVLQPMRQFEAENIVVASCLTFPDAFEHGSAVAHLIGGVIDNTHLIYERLAFPLFLNNKPAYIVTFSGYLHAAPAASADETCWVPAMGATSARQIA